MLQAGKILFKNIVKGKKDWIQLYFLFFFILFIFLVGCFIFFIFILFLNFT